MLEMYWLTARHIYYDRFSQTLDFVENHQVARQGSWWADRRANGKPLSDQRSSPGRAPTTRPVDDPVCPTTRCVGREIAGKRRIDRLSDSPPISCSRFRPRIFPSRTKQRCQEPLFALRQPVGSISTCTHRSPRKVPWSGILDQGRFPTKRKFPRHIPSDGGDASRLRFSKRGWRRAHSLRALAACRTDVTLQPRRDAARRQTPVGQASRSSQNPALRPPARRRNSMHRKRQCHSCQELISTGRGAFASHRGWEDRTERPKAETLITS